MHRRERCPCIKYEISAYPVSYSRLHSYADRALLVRSVLASGNTLASSGRSPDLRSPYTIMMGARRLQADTLGPGRDTIGPHGRRGEAKRK